MTRGGHRIQLFMEVASQGYTRAAGWLLCWLISHCLLASIKRKSGPLFIFSPQGKHRQRQG